MKLNRNAFLIAVICAIAVAAQAQEHAPRRAKTSSVRLGNKVILVPDPQGFEEALSQFPKYKERVLATEGAENDTLLAHLPVSDCNLLRQGAQPTYAFYTKVSVLRAARELPASRAILAEAAESFRKNAGNYLDPKGPTMKRLITRVEKGLSELDAKETDVDFTQPQNLGEFDVRPDINSFMLLMTVKVNSGGTEVSFPMLASLSFVRVNERIIYVYAFKKYQAEADIDELKQFASKWTGGIVAANNRP
jgi:hypothetical protein